MHTDQMPAPLEFLALEPEVEMSLFHPLAGVSFREPAAAVPDHHGPAAILSLRYRAFELVVFDRMILGVDGEPFLAGNETRTFRHGPAEHDAVEFQPKIIMQPRCGVLLNDELVTLALRRRPARLRRFEKVALGVVGPQLGHISSRASPALGSRPSASCLPRWTATFRARSARQQQARRHHLFSPPARFFARHPSGSPHCSAPAPQLSEAPCRPAWL